jgi:hypothetical protein
MVNGIRDGVIYGALGGFGFNVLEIANYVLRVSYPAGRPSQAAMSQLSTIGLVWHWQSRHVWAMLVGAGIGLAVQAQNRRTKLLAAGLGGYLLAVLTHTLQDLALGGIITLAITFVILWLRGINMTELSGTAAADLVKPYIWISSALEALLINIINIPIIVYALLKSGDWERQVIQTELADEIGIVITPDEYVGVQAEKRFRLRQISGYSPRVGRRIRNAQNGLAFQKRYLKQRGRNATTDPLAQYWRDEVIRWRESAAANPLPTTSS